MSRRVAALLIVALTLVACGCSRGDSTLGDRITAKVSEGPGTTVRLADLTDFHWQRLYVFGPYASQQRIDDTLGFSWPDPSGIQSSDSLVLLVFVDGSRVVSYVEQPRSAGDFAGLDRQRPWTPSDAVFVVRNDPQENPGGQWLTVRYEASSAAP